MYQEQFKYENIAIVCKAYGDYKVLATVSGNSKAEVERKMKSTPTKYNVQGNGTVWIDHADFPKGYNSNKF